MAINQYGNQYYTPMNQSGPSIGTNPNPVQITSPIQPNAILNSIVWTETEEEAKTWMVGPNNRVFVFVGNNEVLYIKEKNSDGRPLKTEIYDLNKRQIIEEGGSIDLTGYVKKDDVQSMIDAAVAKALAESNKNRNRNFQNHRNFNRNGGNEA